MPTTTPNLGLTKPDVSGSTNVWGPMLNTDFDLIDAAVAAISSGGTSPFISSVDYGAVGGTGAENTALSNFLAAIPSGGMGILSPGIHRVSSPLTFSGTSRALWGQAADADNNDNATSGSVIRAHSTFSGTSLLVVSGASMTLDSVLLDGMAGTAEAPKVDNVVNWSGSAGELRFCSIKNGKTFTVNESAPVTMIETYTKQPDNAVYNSAGNLNLATDGHTWGGYQVRGGGDPTKGIMLFAGSNHKAIRPHPTDGYYSGVGSMTSGSAALTSTSGTFAASMVGGWLYVAGAGVAGADLRAPIASFTDSTHVTLGTAASTNVTGAVWSSGASSTAFLSGVRAEILGGYFDHHSPGPAVLLGGRSAQLIGCHFYNQPAPYTDWPYIDVSPTAAVAEYIIDGCQFSGDSSTPRNYCIRFNGVDPTPTVFSNNTIQAVSALWDARPGALGVSTAAGIIAGAGMRPSRKDGVQTRSGNGVTTAFLIPHGLCDAPLVPMVVAASDDARGSFKVTATDQTNITVTYASAPLTGTNNLTWYWMAAV